MEFTPDPIAHGALVILCAICTWTDIKEQLIYDWATVPAMVLGLVLAGWSGGTDGLISSLIGGLVGFGTFGLLWYLGLMMSGDVFLMGAVGFLLRFPLVLFAMLYASLLGVVVALVWAVSHGQAGRVWENLKRLFLRLFKRGNEEKKEPLETTPFPFGVAIAGGALWAAALVYYPQLALGMP